MTILWSMLFAALLAAALSLAIAYYCYRVGFYAPRKPLPEGAIQLPEGEIYEKYWEAMKRWTLETRETPHETFTITSFDGLTLSGNYYEYAPALPWRSCSTATGAAPSGIFPAVCSGASSWAGAPSSWISGAAEKAAAM